MALGLGDNLLAYDLARAELDRAPEDARVAHTLVLALARSGATRCAEAEYDRLGLATAAGGPDLRSDLLALHARLAKDRALESSGGERLRWAATASARYAEAATETDRGYADVNAATMAALAADPRRARHHARRALTAVDAVAEGGCLADHHALSRYWAEATRAEAFCVLGQGPEAKAALELADTLAGGDLGAKASTRRQLRLLAELDLADESMVDRLTIPGVAAFGGHRLLQDPEREERLRQQMVELVDAQRVGFAHGSLACGADILWAETLLECGAEVHVVLPFQAEEFVSTSVRPGGDAWVGRHRSILDAATSVTISSSGASLGDSVLYGYAASLFLGRTVVRARALTVTPRFMVVWDGATATGRAGTAADVDQWRATGHPLDVIEATGTMPAVGPDPAPHPQRQIRAALFGDFHGFSGLPDADVPAFVERTLGAVAGVLDSAGEGVLYRNSWGDGIYVVCESAPIAAALAIDLQSSLEPNFGLLTPLRLRLGGHLGPMVRLHDPIQGRETWWGQAVVTAARIEPRTPEGEVYVTEAFAALLSLEAGHAFTAEYVGRIDTAKSFGEMRMYVLKTRPAPDTSA